MDLQQLREETRPEHDATEAAMPLMGPGLTLSTYTGVLRALLPVLRSWEAWAAQSAPESLRPLLPARRRSHLIEQDLYVLAEPEPLIVGDGSAPIDWRWILTGDDGNSLTTQQFEAAFLGALYVLEGSTLGGRIIARHVETVLGLHDGRGNAYFRGHGEATGALWRETAAAIAAVPDRYAALVIGAARRSFSVFRIVLGALQPEDPATTRV